MHIIVCVKQIADPQQVRIHRETREPILEDAPLVISDIDKNALEEAIRIKERLGNVTVTALSLGSDRLRQTIKLALAMGADQAAIITDPQLLGGDPMCTAAVLAAAVRKMGGAELILLGEGSADNYSGQVGPRLAVLLDLPDVTYVRRLEIEASGPLRAVRSLEDGLEVVRVDVPALVTVVAEINEPRIPSVRNIMAAARKPLLEWGAADLVIESGREGLPTAGARRLRNVAPLEERKHIIFGGDLDQAVAKLADVLRQ